MARRVLKGGRSCELRRAAPIQNAYARDDQSQTIPRPVEERTDRVHGFLRRVVRSRSAQRVDLSQESLVGVPALSPCDSANDIERL